MDEQDALCLRTGRSGCDAQMTAVARHLGYGVVDTVGRLNGRPAMIAVTGPERAFEAVALGRAMKVPVIGFGQPGTAARDMDLVVTTPQFDVPGRNVLRLPFAISPHGSCEGGGLGMDRDEIARLPRPLGLVLVGGDAGPWKVGVETVLKGIVEARRRNRTVIVMTSRRTTSQIHRMLAMLRGPDLIVDAIDGLGLRLTAAIHACDEAFVTGDSVSMISEVAAAPRPVAVIMPVSREDEVEAYLAAAAGDPVESAMPGDLRAFWSSLDGDVTTPALRPVAMGMLHRTAAAVSDLLDQCRDRRVAA